MYVSIGKAARMMGVFFIVCVPDVIKTGEPFNVELEVGKKLTHPNMPGHWIQYIELFTGESLIDRLELSAVTINVPKIKFTVQEFEWSDHELVVRERCNLYGAWETRKKIEID